MPTGSSESAAAQAYRLGMSLVKEGRVDEAISHFKNGLTTDPQNALLLNVVGATYTLKGESQQAEGYLLLSLQADPGFVPARKNLAISYFNQGKYDLAAAEFQKLLNEPGETRSVALLFLGIIAEEQRQFTKSASLLEESGEVVFHYPRALLSFAHSLFELKNAQRADAVLKSLDTMSGVVASEYFSAGVLYSKQKQYLGQQGNVGRNTYSGPGLANINTEFAKVMNWERFSLEFRADVFNLFNRVNLTQPDGDLSSSLFG